MKVQWQVSQDLEVEILFIKGYTVFNVGQIEGLPETYYEVAEPIRETAERDALRKRSSLRPRPTSVMVGSVPA
jgi:antirestriction protein ArdC